MPDIQLLVDRDVRFEEVYRAYAGRVRAYVLRRALSSSADDVVAEVFLVAWRRLDAVPEDAFPWLLGVARRIMANRRRGEQRSGALLQRLSDQLRHAGGGLDESDERALRAFAQLSEDDQELLSLAVWEELAPAELASVLGIRKGTVAVRLHRARRRFEAALAAEDAQETTPVEVSR
jgi:RNA polymerase sigma-70 factor (ECF subfamily)